MKSFLLRYYVIILLILSTIGASSQEVAVNGPDAIQCGGFLVDDGLSAGPYGANQNQSITICAVLPETIVNLYFTICDLGLGDNITIYDGNSIAAPLVGTYISGELQGVDITSTNAAGCLTVQFVSDAADNGNFAAEISCGLPCVRPIPVIDSGQGALPILICVGETITFDASTSIFAPGTNLQSLEWVFDDGITNTTTWPIVSHNYDEPGGFRVQLLLTDDNDCSSSVLTDYVVLVSTYPNYTLLSPDLQVCNGIGVTLGANFNSSSTYEADSLNSWVSNPWTDLPDINLGGFIPIPDDQTQCFENAVTFTNVGFGEVIDSPSDIGSVSVNMEHSFLGDLVINIICPNGQSVVLHQQGGGATALGIPDEADNGVPGIGWDYSWSPNSTLGTMADEAINIPFGEGLPSGTYQAVESWNSLIGCPLNGVWTIEICDLWNLDDGYIFDWAVEFNPQLYGDLLSFTPIYGADCDSSFWEGPFIGSTSNNCDFVTLTIPEPGSYDYTYTLINDFGCSFDTIITVVVAPIPALSAGPDLNFNCQQVSFQGGLVGAPTTGYVFYWTPNLGLSNPASPTTPINSLAQTTEFMLSSYPNGNPECIQTDNVLVTLIDYMDVDVPASYNACDGDLVTLEEPIIDGGTAPFTLSWIMDDAFVINSNTLPVIVSGLHEYCGVVEDFCGLMDTACTVVTAYPIIPATFQVNELFGCEPHKVLMTSDYIQYQNIAEMTWHFEDGTTANTIGSTNHEFSQSGFYSPWLEIADYFGCIYADTLANEIAVWPTPIASFATAPVEATLPNTTFKFDNTTIDGSQYFWTFDIFGTSEEPEPTFSFPFNQRGFYEVKILASNQYGCVDSTERQVIVRDEIQIFIPNSFTPDYDGINDVWQISGAGFRQDGFKVEIFNRWGDLVYYSEDPYMAWTGNHKNGEYFAPDGIYLYRLVVRDIENDVNYKYEGHLNLFR